MSERFGDLTNTSYPNNIDELFRMSDLEPSDLSLVTQYYSLINSGKMADARQFLVSNPQLVNKIHNAEKYNKMADAIIAIERFFLEEIDSFTEDIKKEIEKLIDNTQIDLNVEINRLEQEIDEFRDVGEYDENTPYKKKNVVSYLKCAYICKEDCQGISPIYNESSEYWMLIARGLKGESGTGLTPRGDWTNDIPYYVNDMVYSENVLWQALNGNINSKPVDDNENWLNIMSMYNYYTKDEIHKYISFISVRPPRPIDDVSVILSIIDAIPYDPEYGHHGVPVNGQ